MSPLPDPPQPSPAPQGDPDRRALLEAYQDVVREDTDRRNSQPTVPTLPSRTGVRLLTGALLVALVVVLVQRPAWLFTRPPVEPPALQDASLRVRMYVEIDRVERFRAGRGRLPATLAEAGGDSTGLRYQVVDTGFTLAGQNGGTALTYSSATRAKDFLGDSYTIIRNRKRP